eukprot:4818388-Lingulodinium_polyedra.AAC.1
MIASCGHLSAWPQRWPTADGACVIHVARSCHSCRPQIERFASVPLKDRLSATSPFPSMPAATI